MRRQILTPTGMDVEVALLTCASMAAASFWASNVGLPHAYILGRMIFRREFRGLVDPSRVLVS